MEPTYTPIILVNSSIINDIKTNQSKPTSELKPNKEILKKINQSKLKSDKSKLKKITLIKKQVDERVPEVLNQLILKENSKNLDILLTTAHNVRNSNCNSLELLKTKKSDLKNIQSPQTDEDLENRIRSLYLLKVEVDYHEYNPHCRFKSIRCPSASSVNYPKIHANRVDLGDMYFIAMQYPTTIQKQFLWELCLTNNSVILDLTNDADKRDNYLIDYFPNSDELKLKNIPVKYLSEEILFKEKNPKSEVPNTITLYQYELTQKNSEKKIVIPRLQYTGWPDKSVPSMDEMTVIVKEVLKYQTNKNQRPMIHCVAGSGRTMTLIVACHLYKYIHESEHHSDSDILDFLANAIISARTQRGQHAINDRQCQFLFYWGQHLRDEKNKPTNESE